MKVLSVRQPWAWGLVAGPKRVENRAWRTAYRGPLLIHAGRTVDAVTLDDLALLTLPVGAVVPTGGIVGVVTLVDCVRPEDRPGDPFAGGPWCWVTARPAAFRRPFRCPARSA